MLTTKQLKKIPAQKLWTEGNINNSCTSEQQPSQNSRDGNSSFLTAAMISLTVNYTVKKQ